MNILRSTVHTNGRDNYTLTLHGLTFIDECEVKNENGVCILLSADVVDENFRDVSFRIKNSRFKYYDDGSSDDGFHFGHGFKDTKSFLEKLEIDGNTITKIGRTCDCPRCSGGWIDDWYDGEY